MACEPAVSEEVVQPAVPALRVTAEHSVVELDEVTSVKVTDPVGDKPPDTVAVKVSESPTVDGLVPLLRPTVVEVATAVPLGETDWTAMALEPALVPSPE